MATVLGNNKVKLNNGQIVDAQTGGWYDGQQYWNGSLSQPGQINVGSNQPGAGQAVSQEVVAQTNPENVTYLEGLNKTAQPTTPAPGVGTGTPGVAGPTSPTTTPVIDLTGKYNELYKTSGVADVEAQMNDLRTKYNEALAKNNDNPWLSEATRSGREAKLRAQYENSANALQSQITNKNTEIQTQLGLAKQQYEYQTEADKTAAAQAALAGKKNTQTIQSTDDSGNVTITIIDQDTGDIISQKSLGALEKATKKTGTGTTKTGGLTPAQKTAAIKSARKSITAVDINQDKLLSQEEYTQAVKDIMTSTGVDFQTADDYAQQAFDELGYDKWNW